MSHRRPRRHRQHQRRHAVTDALVVGAMTLLVTFAFLNSHAAQGTYTGHRIPAPDSVRSLDELAGPPGPVERMRAFHTAWVAIGDAQLAAHAAVPEVPWGEHGLADVQILWSMIRWDAPRGRYVADLPEGNLAILTLDPTMQQRMERVMRSHTEAGEAAVAIDPGTGRVVALLDDRSSDLIPGGLARRNHAWAASTYKVITGAALLEAGVITPQTQTCIHGGGDGFDETLLDDNAALDTLCISFTRAMALSANVVFGRHADRHLTRDQLLGVSNRFGFNTRIPFEMLVEPSLADLPRERLAFAQAAAGFRHVTMSPLHGALIQAAIANDGLMMVPTIVESILDRRGQTIYEHQPAAWRQVVEPSVARQLLETQSTTCTNGTARAQFAQRPGWPAAITVYGKTGTLANRLLDGTLPPDVFTYSWFTGVGERDGRRLAVSALAVQNPSWQIKGAYLASELVLAGLPATR